MVRVGCEIWDSTYSTLKSMLAFTFPVSSRKTMEWFPCVPGSRSAVWFSSLRKGSKKPVPFVNTVPLTPARAYTQASPFDMP